MKLRSITLLTLILAAFTATVSAQKPESKPSPSPSPTPPSSPAITKLERETKFDGSVTFPEVEGWELSEKTQYPTPDMGYSVNYESPSSRVTVYVYNGGQASIPNTLTGVVAQEVKNAQSQINAIVDAGAYESAKVMKDETVVLGGAKGKIKALLVQYTLRVRGRDLDSRIYLFPYNNYFIKIRMTGLPVDQDSTEMLALLEAIDLLFSK